MNFRLLLFALVCSIAYPHAASAQFAGPGMTWTGSSGAGTGSFQPNCTDYPLVATRGERVDLTVWGDVRAPFGVFLAAGVGRCQMFPSIGGGLLLAGPVVPVASGVLDQISPCLACPPGHARISFAIPATAPIGLALSFQGLSLGNAMLAFTCSISPTVR